ncbi:glycosyltransferase family 4 protein [Bacillus sp. C1]
MKKVALIKNIPSPYRQGLFEEVNRRNNIDLTVYYCAKTEKTRDWNIAYSNYKYKVLPGFTFKNIFHVNLSILKELFKHKYDVVILGGYAIPTLQLAFLYAKLTNTSLILWSESTLGDHNQEGNSLRKKFKKRFLKYMVKRFDKYIVPGTEARKYLMNYGAENNNIITAPTTCDITYFREKYQYYKESIKEIKENLGIDTSKVILNVGRLIDVKGIDVLLKSFASYQLLNKDVTLLLVGDGEKFEEYKKIVDEQNLKVIFTGFIQVEELPKYYAISDVFVFPSKGDVWGLVVNEAMASSLPIITTNKVGASIDLVTSKNGRIVKANNVDELYYAIKDLLDNEELKTMGKESWEKIQDFSHTHAAIGFERAVNAINSK